MPFANLFNPPQFIFEGLVGTGEFQAKRYRDGEGNRFILKSSATHKYLLSNELISMGLAEAIGLLTPDYFLRSEDGVDHFGTSLIKGPSIAQRNPFDIRERLLLPISLGELLALDVLILNWDRHLNNIHVTGNDDEMIIHPIDHNVALLDLEETTKALIGKHLAPCHNWIHKAELMLVKQVITSFAQMEPVIRRVKAISDEQIDSLLNRVPSQHLDLVSRRAVRKILIERRDSIEVHLKQFATVALQIH